jgi:hypothetical protein
MNIIIPLFTLFVSAIEAVIVIVTDLLRWNRIIKRYNSAFFTKVL